MAITFARLQEYLDKISESAHLDPVNSAHGLFWQTSYQNFMTGNVPHKICDAKPVPIIDPVDKSRSAFYLILQNGWCLAPPMPQMPRTGPFVTDVGYSISLTDGTKVSGTKILQDIKEWLAAGAPENG